MEHISKMTKSTSVPNSFFSAGLGFPCLSIREKQNRNLKVAAEFQAEAGWKGFGSQYISEAAERPHALLNENSGASHGQNSRSTGQPRRNETLDAAILVDSHFEVSDPCFFALGKLAVRGE